MTTLLCLSLLLWAVPVEAALSAEATPPSIVVPTVDDGQIVSWRALTWDDFNGEIGRFRREAAGILSQVVVDRINFEIDTTAAGQIEASLRSLRVFAAMNRLQSVYRAGSRSEWTLAHEQGHFDITEVCARRLRRQLEARTFVALADSQEQAQRKVMEQLEPLYQASLAECSELQSRYDGETVHGTKKARQKKWWKTIEQWLAEAGG